MPHFFRSLDAMIDLRYPLTILANPITHNVTSDSTRLTDADLKFMQRTNLSAASSSSKIHAHCDAESAREGNPNKDSRAICPVWMNDLPKINAVDLHRPPPRTKNLTDLPVAILREVARFGVESEMLLTSRAVHDKMFLKVLNDRAQDVVMRHGCNSIDSGRAYKQLELVFTNLHKVDGANPDALRTFAEIISGINVFPLAQRYRVLAYGLRTARKLSHQDCANLLARLCRAIGYLPTPSHEEATDHMLDAIQALPAEYREEPLQSLIEHYPYLPTIDFRVFYQMEYLIGTAPVQTRSTLRQQLMRKVPALPEERRLLICTRLREIDERDTKAILYEHKHATLLGEFARNVQFFQSDQHADAVADLLAAIQRLPRDLRVEPLKQLVGQLGHLDPAQRDHIAHQLLEEAGKLLDHQSAVELASGLTRCIRTCRAADKIPNLPPDERLSAAKKLIAELSYPSGPSLEPFERIARNIAHVSANEGLELINQVFQALACSRDGSAAGVVSVLIDKIASLPPGSDSAEFFKRVEEWINVQPKDCHPRLRHKLIKAIGSLPVGERLSAVRRALEATATLAPRYHAALLNVLILQFSKLPVDGQTRSDAFYLILDALITNLECEGDALTRMIKLVNTIDKSKRFDAFKKIVSLCQDIPNPENRLLVLDILVDAVNSQVFEEAQSHTLAEGLFDIVNGLPEDCRIATLIKFARKLPELDKIGTYLYSPLFENYGLFHKEEDRVAILDHLLGFYRKPLSETAFTEMLERIVKLPQKSHWPLLKRLAIRATNRNVGRDFNNIFALLRKFEGATQNDIMRVTRTMISRIHAFEDQQHGVYLALLGSLTRLPEADAVRLLDELIAQISLEQLEHESRLENLSALIGHLEHAPAAYPYLSKTIERLIFRVDTFGESTHDFLLLLLGALPKLPEADSLRLLVDLILEISLMNGKDSKNLYPTLASFIKGLSLRRINLANELMNNHLDSLPQQSATRIQAVKAVRKILRAIDRASLP
ncbi:MULTISPECIES: hypothetical protein [unclassified Caballeronia]|uniref:hypothetical protein n=1 Tax=unclassified Caballeronia TaxID=2646786 RepID=UPI0020295ECC|nr:MULTISPECIES: hypothetical protein [unclassified Caballeronia]